MYTFVNLRFNATHLRLLLLIFFLGWGLPRASGQDFARVQMIHNAADPALQVVDVYLNEVLILDDWQFRSATAFFNMPPTSNIVFAPDTSTAPSPALATFTLNLDPLKGYVIIASGVLNPAEFAPNPDGRDTRFGLIVNDMARATKRAFEYFAVNGITDSPTLDLITSNQPAVGTLVNNLPYGQFTEFLSVPAQLYQVDVAPSADSTQVKATFRLNLGDRDNTISALLTSGFYNPTDNKNGPGMILMAVFRDGVIVPFTADKFAKAQFIHNSPDPALAAMDIYANDQLIADSLTFQGATSFLQLPADVDFSLSFAPGNSTGSGDALASFEARIDSGRVLSIMTVGVLDPTVYAPNPNARQTSFRMVVNGNARETPPTGGALAWFNILQGVMDLEAVDISTFDPDIFISSNTFFGGFTGYKGLAPGLYSVVLKLAGTEEQFISFMVDLSGMEGQLGSLMLSGFVNPAANQNGPALSAHMVMLDGSVAPLGVNTATDAEDLPTAFSLETNYPNPFNPSTSISYTLAEPVHALLEVYNPLGQRVRTLTNTLQPAGTYRVQVDLSDQPSGVYVYRLQAGSYVETRKMTLVK